MFVILNRFYLRFFRFLYFCLSLTGFCPFQSAKCVKIKLITHMVYRIMIYRITVYRIKKEKILNKWTTWEQCSEHSVQCSTFVRNNLNKSWTHEQKLNNIEISVFMFMCSEHAQKKRVHVHVFKASKMRRSLFICSFCSTFVQCSEQWTSPVPIPD